VHAFLTEAHTVASDTYGVRAAQVWAEGFQFPPTVTRLDADALAAHVGDFPSFVRARQAAQAHRRLSLSRVHSSLGADGTAVADISSADFARLVELAVDGIRIPLPPGFRPCGSPPKLRAKYIQVAAAVNKLLYSQYTTGTVLLLPLDVARHLPLTSAPSIGRRRTASPRAASSATWQTRTRQAPLRSTATPASTVTHTVKTWSGAGAPSNTPRWPP